MNRFDAVMRLIQREPVTFQACVQATLAALVGFGVVHWSNEQIGLVLGAVAAFLALFTRAKVSPTSSAGAAGGSAGAGAVAGGGGAAADAQRAPGVSAG